VTAAAPATGLVVAATRAELAVALDTLRSKGSRIALVPTMGALHEGHRALVTRAAALTDAVVVSIFLNPLQFAAGEDLARYPRTLDSDLALCAAEGVAVVFAPLADEVYPRGEPTVRVAAGGLGEILEGASRPGHFDGVLTVVAKLFGLVRPDVAVFGEKDAQQLRLVRQRRAHVHVQDHGPARHLLRHVNLDPGQVTAAQLFAEDCAAGRVDPLADDAERVLRADRDRLGGRPENCFHARAP